MIDLSVEDFNKLYWGENLSYRMVADRLKITTNQLRSWLRMKKAVGLIETRDRSTAVLLAAVEGRMERCGANNPNYKHGIRTPGGFHRCYNYNISIDEYKEMKEKQGNQCAICGISFEDTKPFIDHCHELGHVRGLLCQHCNTGLGYFKDSIGSLIGAAKYIYEDIEKS